MVKCGRTPDAYIQRTPNLKSELLTILLATRRIGVICAGGMNNEIIGYIFPHFPLDNYNKCAKLPYMKTQDKNPEYTKWLANYWK